MVDGAASFVGGIVAICISCGSVGGEMSMVDGGVVIVGGLVVVCGCSGIDDRAVEDLVSVISTVLT